MEQPEFLIVDDEPYILAEMAEWMAVSGLSCLTASSGTEALECLRRHPSVRLIVTDVKMPGMDGYQLMEAATALRPSGPGLRFIVVTGHLTPTDQARIADYGVDAVMPKPIDLEELEATIRRSLEGAQLDRCSDRQGRSRRAPSPSKDNQD